MILKSLVGPGTAAPQCGSCSLGSAAPHRSSTMMRSSSKRTLLKRFDDPPAGCSVTCCRRLFSIEAGQIATGALHSEWLLSRAVVFPLVTADAALGCGGPRKANDPRDLVTLRLPYPLILRKNLKSTAVWCGYSVILFILQSRNYPHMIIPFLHLARNGKEHLSITIDGRYSCKSHFSGIMGRLSMVFSFLVKSFCSFKTSGNPSFIEGLYMAK